MLARILALIPVLVITLPAYAGLPEDPNRWTFSSSNPYCKGIGNFYECAKEVEKVQIRESNLNISRSGTILRLPLKSGQILEIKDKKDSEGFTFVKFLERINFYLLRVQFYEGDAFVLVNYTEGKIFRIPSIPIISPDNSSIVCVSFDFAYNPVGVWVYELVNGKVVERFSSEQISLGHIWGADKAYWLSPDSIKIQKLTGLGRGLTPQRSWIRLNRVNGKWSF